MLSADKQALEWLLKLEVVDAVDNLKKKVIILDEAQNYTVADLKKTLTRCSDDCKVIVVGHDKQCDLKDKNTTGFMKYIDHFRGHENCEICELTINHRGWLSQFADELEE